MKRIARPALAALLVCTSQIAYAGGLDRSGQSISPLFEQGRYLEFSVGAAFPNVSGSQAGTSISNMADSYFPVGAAYKADISEQLSYALIYDQPFGANVDYPAAAITFSEAQAVLTSHALTGLLRYKFNPSFSVYGGVRGQAVGADIELVAPLAYTASAEYSFGVGYVAGVAYEKPDIALRVALTYNSEINNDWDSTESTIGDSETPFFTPQSVNLDFQTGIAANTLLFGSVRWVNWDGVSIAPPGSPLGPLVEFTDDTISYSLGVGRRFTEQWSGALQLGYEAGTGGFSPNLGPTDGYWSVGAGATYTMQNGTEITGGVRYVMVGDATTNVGSEFENNSALAAGLKVGFNF